MSREKFDNILGISYTTTDTDAKDKAAAEQASNIYNASRLNEPVDRFELEHFRQGFLAGCAHIRKEQAGECVCGETNARNCPVHQSEGREYFHARHENGGEEQIFLYNPTGSNFITTAHVIEKSAYDKQVERVRELTEHNQLLQFQLTNEVERVDQSKRENGALRADLAKTKHALEQANNGRPSDWAYSVLREERDVLRAEQIGHLKLIDGQMGSIDELRAEVERLKQEYLNLEARSNWPMKASNLAEDLKYIKGYLARSVRPDGNELTELINKALAAFNQSEGK